MALILAIDTSSGGTGVAIAKDGAVLSSSLVSGMGKPSESLFLQIEEVLTKARASKEDIEGVAVTRGPGSFTGLRVGLATAKGLAFGLKVKVAGVSTLRALALGSIPFRGTVAVLVDARKRQVYGAAYDGMTGEEVLGEGAFGPEDFAGRLLELKKPLLLAGTGAKAYLDEIKGVLGGGFEVAPEEKWIIDPAGVALLGETEFKAGSAVEPAFLKPVYHRLSEAEENKRKSPV